MKTFPWVVIKFGGTSVRDCFSWQTITSIVKQTVENEERPIVVCSALPGISDLLEKLAEVTPVGEYQTVLDDIISRYQHFAKDAGCDFEKILGQDVSDLKRICEGIALTGEMSATLKARLCAFGELMLTKLGAAYLTQRGVDCTWLDAREVLQSVPDALSTHENNTLNARCDDRPDEVIQKMLADYPGVLITQGFIAKHPNGQTVLLGRGGSDSSAAYFAAKCHAKRCEIWTDVPGIYTTNPSLVPEARLLKSLSYEEALEIAAAGAKVLHPKCIGPLMRNDIPCHIRCTHAPERESTLITSEVPFFEPHVKAIAKRSNITLVVMETSMMWQQVGFLADIFQCFKQHGVSIDLVSTSEKNVTVSIDPSVMITKALLNELLQSLSRYCRAHIVDNAASISLVGRNIRAILHKLTSIFESFSDHKMYMLTQAANDLNLTVVIEDQHADKIVKKMHALLFETHNQQVFLGESWSARQQTPVESLDMWWVKKKEAVLALMQQYDALYLYDKQTIEQQLKSLKSLSMIDQVFYAMKANSHEDILKTVDAAGVNFECVSLGEVERVLAINPNIAKSRILFTPNFAPLKEYQHALEQGYHVTLDNTQPIMDNPEVFSGKRLLLRIDPGVGRGHHQYVITGGAQSKFGITLDELESLKPVLSQHNIKVIGLHAHSGSGILTSDNWCDVANCLITAAKDFPEVKVINLGGGLGIPERFGQSPLDMHAVNDSLQAIKQANPQFQFWMEPGRYVVAQSGILLAKVTQLKQKQQIHYVGISTGMNSLIRPALYGSHHEIVNLSKLENPRTFTANIVGPICESGDTLGYDRLLPETEVNDVILIANAGAYGFAMSSNYNTRAPAVEMMW